MWARREAVQAYDVDRVVVFAFGVLDLTDLVGLIESASIYGVNCQPPEFL